MRAIVLAALGVALLAGCAQDRPMTYRELDRLSSQAQREAVSRPAPDSCQMSAHANLVGTAGDAIDQSTLPPAARIICHNCAATLDYNATRLNIVLGPDGTVASLRCG